MNNEPPVQSFAASILLTLGAVTSSFAGSALLPQAHTVSLAGHSL
jgi:hypothetical protein